MIAPNLLYDCDVIFGVEFMNLLGSILSALSTCLAGDDEPIRPRNNTGLDGCKHINLSAECPAMPEGVVLDKKDFAARFADGKWDAPPVLENRLGVYKIATGLKERFDEEVK